MTEKDLMGLSKIIEEAYPRYVGVVVDFDWWYRLQNEMEQMPGRLVPDERVKGPSLMGVDLYPRNLKTIGGEPTAIPFTSHDDLHRCLEVWGDDHHKEVRTQVYDGSLFFIDWKEVEETRRSFMPTGYEPPVAGFDPTNDPFESHWRRRLLDFGWRI